MAKGVLIEGKLLNEQTFGVIFIEDIGDLSEMDEIEGCSVSQLAAGSIAYDKNQNTAVYDGANWVG